MFNWASISANLFSRSYLIFAIYPLLSISLSAPVLDNAVSISILLTFIFSKFFVTYSNIVLSTLLSIESMILSKSLKSAFFYKSISKSYLFTFLWSACATDDFEAFSLRASSIWLNLFSIC